MATLVLEDGSGVAGANTYALTATIDAYHSNLGNSDWTGTDDEKSTANLRAMRHLESLDYNGTKDEQTNPLEWPRSGAYDRNGFLIDNDVIPQGVINALCEAALIELTSPGALRPSTSTAGQVKRQKVDVIETEYFEAYSQTVSYDTITNELVGLVGGSGSTVKLTRV